MGAWAPPRIFCRRSAPANSRLGNMDRRNASFHPIIWMHRPSVGVNYPSMLCNNGWQRYQVAPPRDWADTTTELVRGSMFSTINHKFVVWFWLGGCAFAALQQISLTPHVLQVIAAGDGIMHVPGCTQVPVAKPSGCLRTRTLFFLCMRLSDWSEDLRL